MFVTCRWHMSCFQITALSDLMHRHRLLEMTVGAKFYLLFPSALPPPLPSLSPPPSTVPSPFSPFPLFSPHFPPYSALLNFPCPLLPSFFLYLVLTLPLKFSKMVWGSAVSSSSVSGQPGRQTLLVHFQSKISTPKNGIWEVSKEKAKQYTPTEITECNSGTYNVHKMLASLFNICNIYNANAINFDCKTGCTRHLHAKIDSISRFTKLT